MRGMWHLSEDTKVVNSNSGDYSYFAVVKAAINIVLNGIMTARLLLGRTALKNNECASEWKVTTSTFLIYSHTDVKIWWKFFGMHAGSGTYDREANDFPTFCLPEKPTRANDKLPHWYITFVITTVIILSCAFLLWGAYAASRGEEFR